MSYHFKEVAVLCAQKNGVYSQSSGICDQFSSTHGQLIEGTSQQTSVLSQFSSAPNQSTGADNQFSCYNSQMVSVDLWDEERDAFIFLGGKPVVAHPPCRLWAKLKAMPNLTEEERQREKRLGRHCVRMVLENGGVLEHPAGSELFDDMGLPSGGYANKHGFTLEFPQRIFGHSMMKPTWFFFAGIAYEQVLPIRPALHFSPLKQIHHLSAAQREATPPALAKWLLYHAAIAEVRP
ncbi:MAG: hypothetical protein JXR40_03840 [Pontiellaceae bacterium]|nr:hypothetical protein [Pontiellaceae bacterium]